MKSCDKCKITIETNRSYCPLCHQTLSGEVKDVVEKYPKVQPKMRPLSHITKRVLLFLTVTSVFVLLVINFFTGFSESFWSIIPIGSIIYFWLLMSIGIMSRHNIAFKLFFLTVTLILLLYLIDEFSLREGWALNYLAPLLLLTCNFAISIIILVKRINYRDYISYLLLIGLFSLVPVVFLIFDVVDVLWPSLTTFTFAITILLFIIFFFPKSIKDEIKKRFHA